MLIMLRLHLYIVTALSSIFKDWLFAGYTAGGFEGRYPLNPLAISASSEKPEKFVTQASCLYERRRKQTRCLRYEAAWNCPW